MSIQDFKYYILGNYSYRDWNLWDSLLNSDRNLLEEILV
jgi:hypothetical protein